MQERGAIRPGRRFGRTGQDRLRRAKAEEADCQAAGAAGHLHPAEKSGIPGPEIAHKEFLNHDLKQWCLVREIETCGLYARERTRRGLRRPESRRLLKVANMGAMPWWTRRKGRTTSVWYEGDCLENSGQADGKKKRQIVICGNHAKIMNDGPDGALTWGDAAETGAKARFCVWL